MNIRALIAASLLTAFVKVQAAPGDDPSRLVESPLNSANLIDTALGLVFVLALVLGLAWLVKRFVQTPGMSKGRVQVLGGVSLGAREKAVLLSVEGKRLLVGIAPGQVRTLMVMDDDESSEPDFAGQLQATTTASERIVEQPS